MNPITILEIIISILVISYIISVEIPIKFDTKYYLFEDLYASLVTLSYQNYSSTKACEIVNKIIPGNYKYQVLENSNIICGDIVREQFWRISHFIEDNGTVYNITIIIGK